MAGARLGRDFLLLWATGAAAGVGDGMRLAIFPIAATVLTRDPMLVAGLATVTTLPWLLFGLASGAVVDRLDRRLVLVVVNGARAAMIAALALAIAADAMSLPLLYAVAFAIGSAETLVDSALPTLLPATVAPDQLERANGNLAVAQTATNEFGGPPLAGVLHAVSAGAALAVNAAAFAAASLLATLLPRSAPLAPDEPRPTIARAVREGLRWLWGHPVLRPVCGVVALLALVDAAWFSILVLFFVDELGVRRSLFGVLLAIGAVGSVAGGALAARVGRRVGTGRAMLWAVVAAAGAQAVLGVAPNVPVAATMLAVSGAAFTVWNVLAASLRQRLAPSRLLGRVNSAYLFLGFGAQPVGALAGGWLADAFGLRAPFLVGAPLLLAGALAARRALRDSTAARADANAGREP